MTIITIATITVTMIMSLKVWCQGNFTLLLCFISIFIQNIGNLPKFNFQAGNLARAAGIIWTKWKSRTFVNVGGSRICSACSGNDGGGGGSLIWECTWRHPAHQQAGARMLAGLLLAIWRTYGRRQGWRIFHFIQHSGQTTGLQLWSRHNKAQMERFAKSISHSRFRIRWALRFELALAVQRVPLIWCPVDKFTRWNKLHGPREKK